MVAETAQEAGLAPLADLVTPMAVRVAATLRLADAIRQGRTTVTQLAASTGADPRALDRVLRHLAARGVLTCDDQDHYGLTPYGAQLCDDHPAGERAKLDIDGMMGRAELAFVRLLDTVRTGRAAFPLQFGHSFWDDLLADPRRIASLNSQMGAAASAWAAQVIPALDWGSLGHVVDVGGGNGSLIIALLREHQSLRGTVVDIPETVEQAREAISAAGLSARADATAVSFFDPLPPGAGGYVLSAVLHAYEDPEAAAILRRCAEAARPGGVVLVIEKAGPDGDTPSTDMDLRVMTLFAGRVRRARDLAELGAGAGLRLAAVHPAGDLAVIELAAA